MPSTSVVITEDPLLFVDCGKVESMALRVIVNVDEELERYMNSQVEPIDTAMGCVYRSIREESLTK